MDANIMSAKEPILSLLFGTIFVCVITLPYFLGIGKSLATQKENPEASLLKFLAAPFIAHLLATLGAVMFINVWNLFYKDLQAAKLINTFWSATAQGASNEWVKAAYHSADLMSMVLFYLIVSIPLVNFFAVLFLSGKILRFQDQQAWGSFKVGAVKIAGSFAVAAILSIFYQKTVDLVMFDKQTLDFKEWGKASSTDEMQTNFFKRAARMGISGKLDDKARNSGAGSSSSSSSITGGSSSSSSSSGSLLDAYFGK